MMRTLTLLTWLTIAVAAAGCNPNGATPNNSRNNNAAVQDKFPAFLVGSWRTDTAGARWIFTFEADGRISKMRHFIGADFDVAEGGLIEPWRNNAEAAYFLGPCNAVYKPESRELTVTIIIEHYTIEFPNGKMEGSFRDHLTGPVSQDGKTWRATWKNESEVTGSGTSTPPPEKLLFTKIETDPSKLYSD